MKQITLITIILALFIISKAQDINDPYDIDQQEGVTFDDYNWSSYEGEYQIDLTDFFWLSSTSDFEIYYSFECVSFPFVPDCITLGSTSNSCLEPEIVSPEAQDRYFNVLSDDDLETEDDEIDDGTGWVNNGQVVYRFTEPELIATKGDAISSMSPTSLISNAYASDISWSDRKILPHSILKMTLYVSTEDNPNNPVQLSWLYDNTRGRMGYYPFIDNNYGTNEMKRYDVVFHPFFQYEGFPNSSNHTYGTTTNVGWFTGATPNPDITPLGSISYYHPGDYPYGSPYYPNDPNVSFPSGQFFYPAPFALLTPPLLNENFNAYAGFDENGEYGDEANGVDEGIHHEYSIDEPIDLNLINPSEKIIYNPSKVEIDCDLLFPEDYKFLTVHGKYPDKAWVMENNPPPYFDDLRDVLCPSDQINENGDFLAEYFVNYTLTIQPGVTIMDAQINGLGTVRYYPDDISGNFKLSPSLKLVFLSDQIIIDEPFVSWENEIEFQGSLISIEPGATLEIKKTLELGNNTKIIVKPAGKLILDGGTLTSAGEYTWAGIEVWGDPNSSSIYDQGILIIKNGATIENAEVAIRNHDPVPEPNKEGGIIVATGSTFKNNIKTVDVRNYNFKSHIRFTDCEFVYTEDYPGTGTPGYFMEIRVMEDVVIESCDFTNNTAENHVGRGILSYASQVTVKADCASPIQPCPDWDNNTFANLEYGIYALGAYGTRFISVEHATFDDNFRGMYIGGMGNAVVTDNNFEVNTDYVTAGGYGLYLDHSTAYKVEENNFFHDGGVKGVGLIVNESGNMPNMIYRNYFTQLECGMDIQGVNRDMFGNGLVLKCNQYEGTLMDKIITYDEATIRGIAHNQGSSSTNPEDMAGNLFQIDGQTPDGNFDDILNEGNSIVYYWPLNNNDISVKPVDYTDNVTPKPVPLDPLDPWTYEDGCPQSEEPGGGGIGIGDTKSSMAESGLKIDSTENLLTILIDGGNTEATQTDVDNSIPPETMQVYNDLMAKSPYLSDTVISTAIEKEDVLPGAMIRDIMVANPKAAKSEKLMDKLDERWDPLPDYMKGQILAGRSVVSIREETESRLAAFKLERAKHFHEIEGYYLNDTIDPAGSMDSLMALYENEDSPGAKYSLAFLSGELGAWGEGIDVLNGIPVQFVLSEKESAEHLQMLDYYNLLSNLAQEGKSILQADSSQIAALFNMETSSNGMAGIYARNILLALNEMEYDEPILMPDMLKSSAAMEEYNYLLGKAIDAPGHIKVKPNPAKYYLIIEYELEQEVASNIEIRDISGNLKYSGNFTNRQDQFTVDARNLKAGIYIATLKINGKLIGSVKFTLID